MGMRSCSGGEGRMSLGGMLQQPGELLSQISIAHHTFCATFVTVLSMNNRFRPYAVRLLADSLHLSAISVNLRT